MIDGQLRKAIADSGQSLNALAKASGVSQPVLSRFVAGQRDIYWATACKLAKELGLQLVKRRSR